MKLKTAIQILMEAARRDIHGAGCGIRSLPSDNQTQEIRAALQRAGKYAYGDWWEDKDR